MRIVEKQIQDSFLGEHNFLKIEIGCIACLTRCLIASSYLEK